MTKYFMIVRVTKPFNNNPNFVEDCYQVVIKRILDKFDAVTRAFELQEMGSCEYIVQEYYEPTPNEIIGYRIIKDVSFNGYTPCSYWYNEKTGNEINDELYEEVDRLKGKEEQLEDGKVKIKSLFRLIRAINENNN